MMERMRRRIWWTVTLRTGSSPAAAWATQTAIRYVNANGCVPALSPQGRVAPMLRTPRMFYRPQEFGGRTGNTLYYQGAPGVPHWGPGNGRTDAHRGASVAARSDSY